MTMIDKFIRLCCRMCFKCMDTWERIEKRFTDIGIEESESYYAQPEKEAPASAKEREQIRLH